MKKGSKIKKLRGKEKCEPKSEEKKLKAPKSEEQGQENSQSISRLRGMWGEIGNKLEQEREKKNWCEARPWKYNYICW